MPDNALPFDPLRPRVLPKPEERRPLSKWEFATLYLEQMGKCKACGIRLEKGQTIDEHLQPLDALGSNDLSNRALYCRPCASEKTSKKDRPRRDHGRRVRGEVGNGPKKQIPSRPFSKAFGRESRNPDSAGFAGYGSPLSKDHPGYRKRKWGRKVKA